MFLLQGEGRRRWQISAQRALELVAHAPLKILRRFRAAREWTLEAGDLLYLPPRYAHDGVALDDCITCSVGFRAPSAQDLCSRFHDYLQDNLDAPGRYADPQLKPTRHPARIDTALTTGLLRLLDQARWRRADMLQFIGMDLSTPKPQVVFAPPRRPLSAAAFARVAGKSGLALAPATILLYDHAAFYINGERRTPSPSARSALRRLADRRTLPPSAARSAEIRDLLYAWYRAGYLYLASPS